MPDDEHAAGKLRTASPNSHGTRAVRPSIADIAADRWLRQALHPAYDGTLNEPIPEELLALIKARGS